MSKIKMRCTTCGKWFQSANAKEVTCPDCVQKARKEKKIPSPPLVKPVGQADQDRLAQPAAPPPKPKPVQSNASHWLDALTDVKVGQPDQPPRPKSSPAPRDNRGGFRSPTDTGNYHTGPAGYRVSGGLGTAGSRPRQPMEGSGFNQGPRPQRSEEPRPDKPRSDTPKDTKFAGQKPRGRGKPVAPKPASPPKPKREKIPPPQPFAPTPEQVTQAEARYLELAVPSEFDGIRTQIAKELGFPKKAVKKIIKDLRDRQQIPSWWELQTYKGSDEEITKIRTLYEPLLPIPPVSVHKQIAEQLLLKPGTVYQAIKTLRQEMNLPQYNDPVLHEPETLPTEQVDESLPSSDDEACVATDHEL